METRMKSVFITFFFMIAVMGSAFACTIPEVDGELSLYSAKFNESITVQYIQPDGTLDADAMQKIQRIMRSTDGREAPIHPKLVTLLDHIQEHFGARAIQIISGYRSPQYNGALKAAGRGVATNSRHMHGDAADIHIDEATEADVRDYVQSLQCGGVGYYPALAFVHVDLGRVRQWAESPGGRKLLGAGPIRVTTNKNVYRFGESIRFQGKSKSLLKQNAYLEIFSPLAKAWQVVTPIDLAHPQWLPQKSALRFGKYRIRVGEQGSAYSNEFYLKRS